MKSRFRKYHITWTLYRTCNDQACEDICFKYLRNYLEPKPDLPRAIAWGGGDNLAVFGRPPLADSGGKAALTHPWRRPWVTHTTILKGLQTVLVVVFGANYPVFFVACWQRKLDIKYRLPKPRDTWLAVWKLMGDCVAPSPFSINFWWNITGQNEISRLHQDCFYFYATIVQFIAKKLHSRDI